MDCMRRRNYAGILLLSLTYWEPAASRRERSGRHPFRLAYGQTGRASMGPQTDARMPFAFPMSPVVHHRRAVH